MDALDLFFKKFAYKFDKGYPDMDNPKDKKLLFELIQKITQEENKISLIKEGSKVYDNTIKKVLGTDTIPTSEQTYEFNNKGGSTFSIQVVESDKEVWNKLFNVAPPKKGEEEGETKGVGNGELALYWLYNYSKSGVSVEEGRKGDDPDLFFNGVGVEVKAYSSHTGKIGLGRFGADKENLALLSVIFGIDTLSKTLGGGETLKTINPTNFKGEDLIPAFAQVLELEKIDDLSGLATRYPIFKTLKDNIDILNTQLNNPDTPEIAAKAMALKMLTSKLGRKPGDGGYLANILKNGDVKFFAINLNKIKESKALLSNFAAEQSAIYVNFDKLFS
jgi:hypothetical protein